MQAPFYQSLAALYRILDAKASPFFKKHQLSISYAALLLAICEQESVSPGKLSEQYQLAPSTVTRLIDKLENRKLVKREKAGKQILITATHQAQKLRNELQRSFEQLEVNYTASLGEALTNKLTNALQEVSLMLKDYGEKRLKDRIE